MLTSNLWVKAKLVNGAIRQIVHIVYYAYFNSPSSPMYMVVAFKNYCGCPCDIFNPTHLLIPSITHGNCHQMSIKLVWDLTLRKAQRMILNKIIIDIGNVEH